MADRVILCPGMVPDFIRGVAVPPQMIDDLHAISQIPEGQIEAIAGVVEAAVGFLGEGQLARLVRTVIDDEQLASSVVSALYNLQPQRLGQVIEVLGEWRRADQRNADKFPDRAIADLEAKLPRLIRDYPALSRSRKASRLRSILGDALQGVELICDARPVFNNDRDTIEGLIPFTTMKIIYEGQDEETREVEVTLTSDALDDLAGKVRKAQQKLDVLNRSIAGWIPDGLADSEESNDAEDGQ